MCLEVGVATLRAGKRAGPADLLDGLALGATSIMAQRRLAVINGRIYAERERLKSKDPSAPPCIVAQILPDRVLLECEGRTRVLCYPDSAAHAETRRRGAEERKK